MNCTNQDCRYYHKAYIRNCGKIVPADEIKSCNGFYNENKENKENKENNENKGEIVKCINTECRCYNEKWLHNCSALNLAGKLDKCPNFKKEIVDKSSHWENWSGVDDTKVEPIPIGNGRIVFFELMRDLIKKTQLGKEKYGTYLRTNNGRNALVDAYQEAIDLCFYLKQRLMEEEE